MSLTDAHLTCWTHQVLDLSEGSIGTAGFAALMRGMMLGGGRRLRELHLAGNGIKDVSTLAGEVEEGTAVRSACVLRRGRQAAC